MSIDPEQLLKLAKDRHGPAGVTLSWPMVINIVDELRRLESIRQELLDERNQALRERDECRRQSKEAPCSSTSPSASPSASC